MRLSITRLALPSLRGMDLGATSVTLLAMPTTDLICPVMYLRTFSMWATVSPNMSSVSSTCTSSVSEEFTRSTTSM